MSCRCRSLYFLFFIQIVIKLAGANEFLFTDDIENHISPEDLEAFRQFGLDADSSEDSDGQASTAEGQWVGNRYWDSVDYDDEEDPAIGHRIQPPRVSGRVHCFGTKVFKRLSLLFNMRPADSREINTHFFFISRAKRERVQVYAGDQFGLEWADFDPARPTAVIAHGFMSHSNASWVRNMTSAFLHWKDMNVITVDWSGGGRTWKYWRAVANTRQVGADLTLLIRQLMNATGCSMRDFHFVGHSLGAHICSYAAAHLGGVRRITGLDPAQPCFATADKSVLLDASDADFVDVIHTNGRLIKRLGLGMPDPSGDADFYPNGGMKQPGCYHKPTFMSQLLPISPTKLSQAICSHGRAYLLFTESLVTKNCSFRAHSWNMTLAGVNASLKAACDRAGSCSEMGIRAEGVPGGPPQARGPYFVLTTATKPFCPTENQRAHPSALLLRDLANGFQLDRQRHETSTPATEPDSVYADPDLTPLPWNPPTTKRPFWKFWKG